MRLLRCKQVRSARRLGQKRRISMLHVAHAEKKTVRYRSIRRKGEASRSTRPIAAVGRAANQVFYHRCVISCWLLCVGRHGLDTDGGHALAIRSIGRQSSDAVDVAWVCTIPAAGDF